MRYTKYTDILKLSRSEQEIRFEENRLLYLRGCKENKQKMQKIISRYKSLLGDDFKYDEKFTQELERELSECYETLHSLEMEEQMWLDMLGIHAEENFCQ